MKQNPEPYDDFISSAGVPTIPLTPPKKRSLTDVIAYVTVMSIIVSVMLIGHEFVYGMVHEFITRYFSVGIIACALIVLIGIVIRSKWVLLAGLLTVALGIGVVLSELSFGVSIAGSVMIASLIYRWYVEKYHYVAERWPIFLGIIALVLGILLIVMQLQIITAFMIAPVLLVLTGAIMIWEVWRIFRA